MTKRTARGRAQAESAGILLGPQGFGLLKIAVRAHSRDTAAPTDFLALAQH